MTMRVPFSLHRTALALAVLLSSTAAQAQDVFIRVPVELGGTAARSTLPFSEPFLLVGAAPAQLKAVDTRFVILRNGKSPPDAKECRRMLDSTTRPDANPWRRDPQVKTDSFAVLVTTGLAANQRYSFCMGTQSSLDSASLSGFQSRAYAILDKTYRALDTGGGPPSAFPAAQLPGLQKELADALPNDIGEIETRGTIFDITDTGVKLTNENLIFTGGVLAAQRQQFQASKTMQAAANTANDRLTGFANHPALRAIAGTLIRRDRVAGMDSSTVERVAQTARVLAFGSPKLLLAVAGGETVLGPAALPSTQPGGPADVTDPAEVVRRAARIDSTYLWIAELRDFSAALQASAALRQRTGVSAPAAGRLRARLDELLETFHQLRRNAARWTAAHATRDSLLVSAARSLRVKVHNEVPLVATTISSFETRARQYVTADLGVAYAPGLGEAVPYFGANFYLGALNKRVPLAVANPPELDRWSVTAGVTASSLARKDVRSDLFGSFSLLLGAGRRMTDPLRLTGGVVIYRRLDPNPLVDDTSIAASPFVSLSFDFDARSALGRLGDKLFP
jgi:hypothetical protein